MNFNLANKKNRTEIGQMSIEGTALVLNNRIKFTKRFD